jgi:hypothetical protein
VSKGRNFFGFYGKGNIPFIAEGRRKKEEGRRKKQ